MDPSQLMQQQEAMRQRAGMPPSAAGIPGASIPSSASPMGAPPMQGGAGGFQSVGAAASLEKQQPDESMFIVKALADRLKKLSEQNKAAVEPMAPAAPTQPAQQSIPTNGADIAAAAAQIAGIA